MPFDFRAILEEHRESVRAVERLREPFGQAAEMLRRCFAADGKVLACGNGGSAADAQHFAAELMGRFERDRPGLAAVALTTDTSALTSIGNDYGFEQIFARQVRALARPGDVLLALSTSGNSPNVLRAVECARERGVKTIGLLGRDGGALAGVVDVPLVVNVPRTSRVQEMHILLLHMLCEAIEAEEGGAA